MLSVLKGFSSIQRGILVVVGGVIGAFLLLRPAQRTMNVRKTIDAPADVLFRLLVEPSTFYHFNRFGQGIHKEYRPSITFKDKTNINYTVTHVTPWKTIITPCTRFSINADTLSFNETFSTAGTTFSFWYTLKEVDSRCTINLVIHTEGPWFMVWATKKAQKDFEWKFDLVEKHWRTVAAAAGVITSSQ